MRLAALSLVLLLATGWSAPRPAVPHERPVRLAGLAETLPRMFVDRVNETIQGTIRPAHISYSAPATLNLRDAELLDARGRRVALVKRATVDVAVTPLFAGNIVVKKLYLDGPSLDLKLKDGELNLIEALRAKKPSDGEPPNIDVRLENIRVQEGRFSFDSDADVKIEAEGLSGRARVLVDVRAGSVLVDASSITARRGRVDLEQLGLPIRRLAIDGVKATKERVLVTGATGRVSDAPARVSGAVRWTDGGLFALSGHLDAPKGTWPERLQKPDFDIPAGAADVKLVGSFERPTVQLDASFQGTRLYGYDVSGGTADVVVTKEFVTLRGVSARAPRGSATAQGNYRFSDRYLDLTTRVTGVPLAYALSPAALDDAPAGYVGGTVRVQGTADGEAPLTINVDAVARNVLYAGVRPPSPLSLDTRLTVTPKRVAIQRGRASGRGFSATAAGDVWLKRERVDLEVTADSDAPLALLKERPPDDLAVASATFRGRVRGPYSDVKVTGDAEVSEADAWGVPMRDVTAKLVAGKRSVVVDPIKARVADGQARGAITVGLPANKRAKPTLAGTFTLEGGDLQQIELPSGEALPVKGLVSLRGQVSGTTEAPVVDATVAAAGLVAGGEGIGRADATLRVTGDDLVAYRVVTEGPIGVVRTGSPLTFTFADQSMSGSLDVEVRALSAVRAAEKAELRGHADGHVTLAGTLSDPEIVGRLELGRLFVKDLPLGGGPADVRLLGEAATTEKDPRRVLQVAARLTGPRGMIDARGAYALERDRVHADVRLVDVDLEPWLNVLPESVPRFAGIARGRVRVYGPPERLDADLALYAPELVVDEGAPDDERGSPSVRQMRAVESRGSFTARARMRDGKLSATVCAFPQADSYEPSPCGSAERVWAVASGPVAQDGSSYDLDVRMHVEEPTIQRFVPALRKEGVRLALDATGNARIRKEAEDEQPQVSADVVLQDARVDVEGAPAGRLAHATRLHVENDLVVLEEPLELDVGESQVKIEGRAGGEEMDLTVDGNVAVALAKLYTREITAATGTVTAHVRVTRKGDVIVPTGEVIPGPDASFTSRSLRQRVELTDGALRFSPLNDRDGFRVTSDDLSMRVGDGTAVLGGGVDVARSESEGDNGGAWEVARWDLRADGERVVVRADDTWLESTFNLVLASVGGVPSLRGSVEVTDGTIRERFKLQNFVITIFESSAPSEPLHETLRPVGLDGLKLNVDFSVREYRAEADLVSFPIIADLGGNVKLEGSVRVPALNGSLEIADGSITFPNARFEIADSRLEFPPERGNLEPRVALYARSELLARRTGCDTDLLVLLSLEGDDLEQVEMDLTVEVGGGNHSRSDLLGNILFGNPLPQCSNDPSQSDNAAARALSAELTSGFTREIEDALRTQLGVDNLRLGVFAGAGGALKTDVRWELGRRVVVEGETPLVTLETGDPNLDAAAATNVRLRFLIFDHVPGGGEMFVEGGYSTERHDAQLAKSGVLSLLFKYRLVQYVMAPLRPFDWLRPPPTAPPIRLAPPGKPLVEMIDVSVARAGLEENAQLERYLDDLIGKPTSPTTTERAQEKLMKLGPYKSAVCRIAPFEGHERLKCGVARARTIRNVYIEGLPLGLLETDLRKRLTLRPGEPLLKAGIAGKNRVSRQRERVERYLDREGYFGAKVQVRTPPVSSTADVDVVIRITGGSFVRVRAVGVESALPFDRGDLEERLGGLCSSGEGLLTAWETGNFACFTEAQLTKATDLLEEELRARGFPEGRVAVRSELVEPDKTADEDCRHSPESLKHFQDLKVEVPPRCVDLQVRVTPGPRVVPTVNIHRQDGAVFRLGGWSPGDQRLESWARQVRNVVEVVARPFHYALELPLEAAPATDIAPFELLAQTTFADSRSTDKVEAELSAKAIARYVASRGYPAARVEFQHDATPDRVDVTFDLYLGAPGAVQDYGFAGNQLISDEELSSSLELATHARDAVRDGFVTEAELDDDVARIHALYESRGFPEVTVRHLRNRTHERVFVTFEIDEGTRYKIGGLRLHGGAPALTPQVLGALLHCTGGLATEQNRTPIVPQDCRGAPFLEDELEAEAQRVLNVYARAGYPYVHARVALDPEWTEAGPIIGVTVWEGSEDAPPPRAEIERPLRVRRGEIFLEGNYLTDREALLNEMGVKEITDERLDPVKVSRGVSRLRKSGLFRRVGYEYLGREEGAKELHLLVQMEERKSARVDTAVQFSTDELGQLRVDWADRNFGGLMLDVGAGGGFGLFIGRRSDINAHFRWPRFLGSNVDFSINPAINYIDRPQPLAPLSSPGGGPVRAKARWETIRRWRIFDVGSRFSVDWNNPLDLVPGLAAGLDYEWRLEWNDPAGATIPLVVPYSAGGFETRLPNLTAVQAADGLVTVFKVPVNQIGVFTPRVRYTAIKNPFDPESGWSAELAVKFGLDPWTLNSQNVVLITSRLTTYLPVMKNFVLAFNFRPWGGYGDVSDTGRSILLRPELLQLGGDKTVRGYRNVSQFGLIGLAEEVADGRHSSELILLGAQLNAELRWTVARGFGIGDLKLALFGDAGFVTDDPRALPFRLVSPYVDLPRSYQRLTGREQLGFSLGVGLRYVTPVGPASLDFAVAPLNDDTDGGRFVHLQFGYAF